MLGLQQVILTFCIIRINSLFPVAWPPGIVRSLKGLPTLKSVEASREESEVSTTIRPVLIPQGWNIFLDRDF